MTEKIPAFMRLVIVESPYAGDVENNIKYARGCIRDCLSRGEAPIASHLLYTQPDILNDDIPGERALGISAGHAWISRADAVVVYTDLGISQGMQAAINSAEVHKTPVEYRAIGLASK